MRWATICSDTRCSNRHRGWLYGRHTCCRRNQSGSITNVHTLFLSLSLDHSKFICLYCRSTRTFSTCFQQSSISYRPVNLGPSKVNRQTIGNGLCFSAFMYPVVSLRSVYISAQIINISSHSDIFHFYFIPSSECSHVRGTEGQFVAWRKECS